jgi:propanol-preferring alcohol dehydrogenase
MSTRIPKTQRAAMIKAFGQDLVLETNHPVKQPSELAPGECLIKLEYAGVCHSDLHVKQGDMKRIPTLPRIGGHEVSLEPLSGGD